MARQCYKAIKLFLPFSGSFLLSGLSLLLMSACQPSGAPSPFEVDTTFYHWQSSYQLSPAEEITVRALQDVPLYLRFFDIDWSSRYGEPIPLAILQVDSISVQPASIIPTVFITNRSLLRSTASQIQALASRMADLIHTLAQQLPSSNIVEVQLDCDWTAGSKEKYFQLLRAFPAALANRQTPLSATIRLHQIKYPEQTGVPPVDRGMLMFYNMGEVADWDESNSILNLETASQYIDPLKKYPLPLDLALPLFNWGVLFRESKMIKLINGLNAEELQDTRRFQLMDSLRYEVVSSTYLDGYYLYQGDRIRLEAVTIEQLRASLGMLKPYFPRKSFTLAYYHLDTTIINRFPYAVLSKLAEQLEQP